MQSLPHHPRHLTYEAVSEALLFVEIVPSVDVKPKLGVPALYYASHLNRRGERLGPDNYGALRHTWERWRSTRANAGRR